LLQKGSVGDDLWNSLLAAEREMEAEIMEVVAEANSFVEGWGTVIFQTANEMIANEKMRSVFEHSSTVRAEKELKYGKTKAIDAQVPTPQAVSSTLAALPAGNAPSPAKPLNGSVPPAPGASAQNPSTPPASPPASLSKASAKKGKKRK